MGEAIRAGRDIDPDEAKIINSVFELFATGHSPKAIARKLNGENIRGPNARDWRDTTIRGHRERSTGILRNELYVGRLFWKHQRYVRSPSSGSRLSRPNPMSEWIVEGVPELRIVNEELWDRCAARLEEISVSPHCGTCGGAMVTIGKDDLYCGNAHRNAGLSTNHFSELLAA